MSVLEPNQGPYKVAIVIAPAIPPKNPGIKCKCIIPLVSNKFHFGITFPKKLKQITETAPANAPIIIDG